jgi:hypothetical protein
VDHIGDHLPDRGHELYLEKEEDGMRRANGALRFRNKANKTLLET